MAKVSPLNKGQSKYILCIMENKQGLINVDTRSGSVSFSKTGRAVYCRDKVLVNIG